MKKIFSLIIFFAIILNLTACSGEAAADKDYFGFCKKDFIVTEEGDFKGGGSYYLILDCSKNREQAVENLSSWNKLPLSENLNLIMYGGEREGVTYNYNLAEKAKIPEVENGYYCFLDRHSTSKDNRDDSELFHRNSFNFSLAVYDSAIDMMYYFEFDT